MPQLDRSPRRPVPRRLPQVGGAFVLLAIAIVAYGLGSRAAQTSRLHDLTEAQAVPTVAIVAPTHVENSAGLDLPGRLEAYIRAPIYARVPGYLKNWKQIAGAAHVLSVPSSALIFDAKGLSIAIVNADNRVLLEPVTIARDLGAVIELASGLSPNDRVIQNPPDGIGNGTQCALPSRRRPARLPARRRTKMKKVRRNSWPSAALMLLLSACSLAPPLKTPDIPTADAYKEMGPWTQAEPADRLPRDSWWTRYDNTELDDLEKRLIAGNPTLAAALANYAAARALADQARAGLFPTLGLSDSVERARESALAPLRGPTTPTYYNANTVGGSVSYELDLWGQIRNEVAAGEANAAASAADLENARLSLMAQLVDDYAQLRSLDRDSAILDQTVQAYARALQRRPDIAGAQRRMIAANANVGVARAAYFPTLTLGAQGGFQSTALSNLLSAPSSFWAIGPNAPLSVFDGGLRRARVAQARAEFDASAANYRSTVVGAFQQVEDSLASLNHYHDAAVDEKAAVDAAQRTLDMSMALYKQGAMDYLTVVTSQTAVLQTQLEALNLDTLQLRASVDLIRALGGGWEEETGSTVPAITMIHAVRLLRVCLKPIKSPKDADG